MALKRNRLDFARFIREYGNPTLYRVLKLQALRIVLMNPQNENRTLTLYILVEAYQRLNRLAHASEPPTSLRQVIIDAVRTAQRNPSLLPRRIEDTYMNRTAPRGAIAMSKQSVSLPAPEFAYIARIAKAHGVTKGHALRACIHVALSDVALNDVDPHAVQARAEAFLEAFAGDKRAKADLAAKLEAFAVRAEAAADLPRFCKAFDELADLCRMEPWRVVMAMFEQARGAGRKADGTAAAIDKTPTAPRPLDMSQEPEPERDPRYDLPEDHPNHPDNL